MDDNIDEVCPDCGHSLKDNMHGPDQGDYYIDEQGDLKHYGSCIYCKFCREGNPNA
jgi:hypothetical protein